MMADRVILVCTVVIAAVYLYATTLIPTLEIGDPLGPKAFPRLLGIGLLLAAGMLGMEILAARKQPSTADGSEPAYDVGVLKVLACVVVWCACYYAAFEALGFIVATSVFLLPMMVWFNRGKWIANVLSSILFSVGTYLLFGALDVSLPKGLLPF